MDREATTPPYTVERNEEHSSSLRSRSYGGAEPPDRSQVLFILSTTKKKQSNERQ